jgi:asparagine synthase (glutamine-hydrolysing)
MCGIAGFLSFNNQFSQSTLEYITNSLTHRGPDAHGYYFDGKAGLGHRRLSIIDLSVSANQPMFSHCGRYAIIFNGEIYNFREIAKDLDVELKTNSDTEVLLEAFVKFGESFIHKVNGMFAFAIYDIKSELLYLYRDRIGIKPLYYYHSDNNFLFASELKAFNNISKLDNGGVDFQSLNDFLYLGYIPAPQSVYNKIKKIPPGTFAVVGNNTFRISPYWKLDEQIEHNVIIDIDEAKNKLRELLFSSVKYRMISDVPFGTFLSGGIDSSLVTAIAQKISDIPLKTFSIGFDEGKFNEAFHARKVAEYLKTEHYEKVLSYADALDLLDTFFDSFDEPFSDSSAFPTLLVSKFAREKVTVILSGDGGDETYLGYGAYNWGRRLSNPAVKFFRKPIARILKAGNNRQKRAAELFAYQDKSRIKSHIFSQEQFCFSEREINALLNDNFKTSFSFDENYQLLNRTLSITEEQALFDLQYYLPDDLLTKVDRASMRYSLEVRVPLLDYRLVHFALNLNEELRKKRGITKYLLKQILFEFVPEKYFDRPKWGFSIPLIQWLNNEWRFLIEDYLNKEAIESVGIFNYQTVNQYVKCYLNGETYFYNRIWIMIIVQRFYKHLNK